MLIQILQVQQEIRYTTWNPRRRLRRRRIFEIASQRVSIEFQDKRLERSAVDRCIEDLSRLLDVNRYISSSSRGARQDSIVSGGKIKSESCLVSCPSLPRPVSALSLTNFLTSSLFARAYLISQRSSNRLAAAAQDLKAG